MTHESSLAVLEANVAMSKQTLDKLVVLAAGQTEVNHNLQQSIALLQQAQSSQEKKSEADSHRIDTLMALRDQMRGGWLALSIIVTCLCTLAGFIGAWIKTKIAQ